MSVQVIASLTEVAAKDWNALDLGGNPFLQHEFLLALEQTGCANATSGWQPLHFILRAGNEILGALPLYAKPHSWGEFVFDWSWSSAYARSGLEYFPKLLSAVPFTPATGSRLLAAARPPLEQAIIRKQLIESLLQHVRELGWSSAHILFTTSEEQQLLEDSGFIARYDCQFHWRNRDFKAFDDFIATFRADKRKKALRERRRVAEAGITFDTVHGDELNDAQWRVAMQLSEATFNSHGHEHYLNEAFFRAIGRDLPRSIMIKFAMFERRPVACAIFFRGGNTLYGRYWGAAAEFHSLHFETCYFQGIEYCIEHGLLHFEPGTQGEHKIARGFGPTKTSSAHWIANPQFARAIAAHAAQEREAVDGYIESVNEHLPFRRGDAKDAENAP